MSITVSNSVTLIGRLVRDVELQYLPNDNQTAVARFTLAVDRPRRNGEDQGADFIRVVVFGRQGENCDRYLSKGRQAAVLGRLETGSYKNREGVTVYTTDVVADSVQFLGGGGSSEDQGSNASRGNGARGRQDDRGERGGYSNRGSYDNRDGYQESFNGYEDDLPDTFQNAEDDIPF